MASKTGGKKSKELTKARAVLRTTLGIRAHPAMRFDEVKRMLVVEPRTTPAEMRGILNGKVQGLSLTELLLAERRRDLELEL